MKGCIVTTTINPPTQALERFAALADWELIVVGDLETPHREYERLDCLYLHPHDQEERYPELCEVLPWRSIQRRNLGLVEAWNRGADVVATVDDDNIPYDHWGSELLVGREIEIDLYEPEDEVFDPLSVTSARQLWHRGFPIELVPSRHRVRHLGRKRRRVLVQADLWDGDPDIDAVARLALRPRVEIEPMAPFGSSRIAPFNSQNTFLSREVLPDYAVLPHVGRMCDVWGSYLLQSRFKDCVVYNRPSVRQERTPQDTVKNLEDEILGYRHSLAFVRGGADLQLPFVPEATRTFYQVYRRQFAETAPATERPGAASRPATS
ncbi:MAG: hypothetical protein AAF560_18030 [Acidobacteriota bacterium]